MNIADSRWGSRRKRILAADSYREGAARAAQRSKGNVAVCFSATARSRGEFYEALNISSYGAPIVFVCENNQDAPTTRSLFACDYRCGVRRRLWLPGCRSTVTTCGLRKTRGEAMSAQCRGAGPTRRCKTTLAFSGDGNAPPPESGRSGDRAVEETRPIARWLPTDAQRVSTAIGSGGPNREFTSLGRRRGVRRREPVSRSEGHPRRHVACCAHHLPQALDEASQKRCARRPRHHARQRFRRSIKEVGPPAGDFRRSEWFTAWARAAGAARRCQWRMVTFPSSPWTDRQQASKGATCFRGQADFGDVRCPRRRNRLAAQHSQARFDGMHWRDSRSLCRPPADAKGLLKARSATTIP